MNQYPEIAFEGDITLTIKQLANMGNDANTIASVLKCNVLKVRAVIDEFYMEKKREAAETKRLRASLLKVRQYVIPEQRITEPKGTFLATQEGMEALERINRRYEPSMPEMHSLKKGCIDGKPSLFHDAGWGERKVRGLV